MHGGVPSNNITVTALLLSNIGHLLHGCPGPEPNALKFYGDQWISGLKAPVE